MMESYDAIVIGAGLGGLTTGALLAKQGARVLIVEQHYLVGGCASTFRRKKFIFDAAVHLIGGLEEGGMIHSILDELGIIENLEIERIPSMYRVQVGVETFDVPSDPDRFAEKLIHSFPADEEAIMDTLREFRQVGTAILTGNEMNKRMQGRILALQNISIKQYLANRFIDPKIEFLLSSLYPYIGAMPSEIDALYYMTTMMSYRGGGFYVKGSSQVLSDSLKASVERDGGKVVLHRRVEKILLEDGKVCGIRDHKGEEYMAPVVVSNADLKKTYLDMVGEDVLAPALASEIKNLTPSISAVLMYAAIENDGWEQKKLAHETFIFPDERNDAKNNSFNPLDPHTKPWLSVCCPTHSDPSLAPEGYSIVSIMTPCDGNEMEQIRNEKGKTFIENRLWEYFNSRIPGLQERTVLSVFATPRTVERYTKNSNGAVYGWKKSLDQQKRLETVSRSFIPGLHVVGHWSKYGHGVFGVMNGGRLLASSLKKESRLKV